MVRPPSHVSVTFFCTDAVTVQQRQLDVKFLVAKLKAVFEAQWPQHSASPGMESVLEQRPCCASLRAKYSSIFSLATACGAQGEPVTVLADP